MHRQHLQSREREREKKKKRCSCLECGGQNGISHISNTTASLAPSQIFIWLVAKFGSSMYSVAAIISVNLPYRRIFLSSALLDAWSTLILAPDSCSKPRIVSPPAWPLIFKNQPSMQVHHEMSYLCQWSILLLFVAHEQSRSRLQVGHDGHQDRHKHLETRQEIHMRWHQCDKDVGSHHNHHHLVDVENSLDHPIINIEVRSSFSYYTSSHNQYSRRNHHHWDSQCRQ